MSKHAELLATFPAAFKSSLLQYFPKGLVAIDFETTGLSSLTDDLVEIAAVKLAPDQSLSAYSTLVNPQKPIPPNVTKIHGIGDEMVLKAPTLSQLFETWQQFMGGFDILAHNALFDAGFLLQAFYRQRKAFPLINVFCSVRLARALKPPTKDHKLPTLAQHFEVPLHSHHRALDDAFACLWITGALLQRGPSPDFIYSKSKIFELKNFTSEKSFDFPQQFTDLIPAVRAQDIVEIEYYGGKTRHREGPRRFIKPFGFLSLPHAPILQALCLRSGEIKSFNLKKLRDFNLLSPQEQEHLLKDFEMRMEEKNEKKQQQNR